jgi:hypothetical protein
VSLFEAVLARWLVELSGRQYFIDDFPLHPPPEISPAPGPGAEPSTRDESASESESLAGEEPGTGEHADAADERFPRLTRFRGLLEAGAQHLAAAKAAQTEQCRQAGRQARALAAFAAARPAAVLDRPDAEVGSAAAASRASRPAALTAVSEWAVDEVMVALGVSSAAATGLLADSVILAERLPATLAALEAGVIGWLHARAMVEIVGPVKDEARAEVEARLLARADGKTVAWLRHAARRAVLRADAAAATQRLARAIRDRGVRLFPGQDGMGSLAAVMAMPVAQACRKALAAYAEECTTPGDERTLEQRMVDCLVDLILRPGLNPPVQIGLTLVAGVDTMAGGDQPAEIDGQPVPAILARELAYSLGVLPRPATFEGAEAADAPAADTRTTAAEAPTDSATDDHASPPHVAAAAASDTDAEPAASDTDIEVTDTSTEVEQAGTEGASTDSGTEVGSASAGPSPARDESTAATLADLLAVRRLAGTGLAHIPEIAVIDEISGQLLALTNATQLRHTATCGRPTCRTGRRPCTHPPQGPGVGPPPATDGYSPSDPLGRFVRARDRRCRFPGCRAAAIRCDLDHNTPWPAGATSADNLCCLCRHHHRLSHQAPGWTMTRLPDGGLQWTTPGGDTITTHPPRYGTDDDLSPPGLASARTLGPGASQPVSRRLTAAELLAGRPLPPGVVDRDPPPF